MLGPLPLFRSKPLRYQVSKQFTSYHYLFVFYTSRCTADRAVFRAAIWKQQCRSGNTNTVRAPEL